MENNNVPYHMMLVSFNCSTKGTTSGAHEFTLVFLLNSCFLIVSFLCIAL
jgi:hypothetical protein